jgi:hypothetical protein
MCPSVNGVTHAEANLLPVTRFEDDELEKAIRGMDAILKVPQLQPQPQTQTPPPM